MDQVIELASDRETLEDFYDMLTQVVGNAETVLLKLECGGLHFQDVLDLTEQFSREIDVIKNRAFAAHCDPILELITAVESVVDRMNEVGIDFRGTLPEAMLMILDRIVFMAEDAYKYNFIRIDSFNAVQGALAPLLNIKKGKEFVAAEKAREILTGGIVSLEESVENIVHNDLIKDTVAELASDKRVEIPELTPGESRETINEKLEEDLTFFKSLADEVDLIHKNWAGRTDFMMPIALGMNAIARNCVDFYQLQAAVYLHDVGMRFLPDELLDEKGKFTQEHRDQLRGHPGWVIDNLDLMEGWNEAAWIVYQHHEKMDGTGYPEGTNGDEICDGAKILAICDAFYSVMARTKSRSIFRAISEINACQGHHFCPKWVSIFNLVIRIQTKVYGY
ncbi:MAG: HD domain-containing protein [Gammaproteobacteria bacterium]|nr:MAG: HD domain-containing protein [Gammaproteobacteria bacterium]